MHLVKCRLFKTQHRWNCARRLRLMTSILSVNGDSAFTKGELCCEISISVLMATEEDKRCCFVDVVDIADELCLKGRGSNDERELPCKGLGILGSVSRYNKSLSLCLPRCGFFFGIFTQKCLIFVYYPPEVRRILFTSCTLISGLY